MVETYLRQGPLAPMGLAARAQAEGDEDAGVCLREVPGRGQIVLRCNVASRPVAAAARKVLGFPLPRKANTVAGDDTPADGPRALWLGPDEWLIVAAAERRTALLGDLRDALAGRHAAVVDVSESRAVFELSGRRARDVLMKGCPLDLHPLAFRPGQCAGSLLAKAHVLIHQTALNDDMPVYEVYVQRSFADYLWRWLEDAGQEYGVSVITA